MAILSIMHTGTIRTKLNFNGGHNGHRLKNITRKQTFKPRNLWTLGALETTRFCAVTMGWNVPVYADCQSWSNYTVVACSMFYSDILWKPHLDTGDRGHTKDQVLQSALFTTVHRKSTIKFSIKPIYHFCIRPQDHVYFISLFISKTCTSTLSVQNTFYSATTMIYVLHCNCNAFTIPITFLCWTFLFYDLLYVMCR